MNAFLYRLLLFLVPHLDIVKRPHDCRTCGNTGFTSTQDYGGVCSDCGGQSASSANDPVVYLRRFFLFRPKWLRKIGLCVDWGNLYLHHILRSDDDPDPHDHPWDFTTLVLAGGYDDEQWGWHPRRQVRIGAFIQAVKPGMKIRRNAKHIHRVRLRNERPAWTLVRTGPYRRHWGFWTEKGFVLWWTYLGVPMPKNIKDDL